MTLLAKAHSAFVFSRRITVLARELAAQLPRKANVLDIGCGSGDLASIIMGLRPDVRISGVDVFVRPETRIPVSAYDGVKLPFEDASFDVAMMVDVLHHTDDPAIVLSEAKRVARAGVLIKDHFKDGWLAGPTLRLMDWVGNAPHGVRLPYNYLSEADWRALWIRLGLTPTQTRSELGLYPKPFGWVFDRRLHFITTLRSAG